MLNLKKKEKIETGVRHSWTTSDFLSISRDCQNKNTPYYTRLYGLLIFVTLQLSGETYARVS